MNKFITLFLCSAIFCLSNVAAQPIYGDFDAEWVSDTKGNGALPGMYLRPGTQPLGWEASNVNQKVLTTVTSILVTPDEDRKGGEGYSAKMLNKTIGLGALSSGAPGYITLGVPWVYTVMNIASCDGGTVGGIEYSQRPDSLVGYYKRTVKTEEDALILAYLWKGTSVSTVRTNSSGSLTSSETKQVVDQDFCVLGQKEADESSVELIGKAEYNISTELEEWTRISIPVDYYSDEFPEKLNIIISASNYWDRSAIKPDNILWADDVELVCNSELKSITIGGKVVEGFTPKTYDYYLLAEEWDMEQIEALAYGAHASVTIQKENSTVTIVVTDETAKGQKTHTYTIVFSGMETTVEVPSLPETCMYGQEADFRVTSNNPYPLLVQSSDSAILRVEQDKLLFLGAGKATLVLSQEGDEKYLPYYKEIEVTIEKAPLSVNLVDVTSKYGHNAVYTYEYQGLLEKDEALLAESLDLIFSKLPDASGYVDSRTKVNAETAMGTYSIKWVTVPEAYNYTITADKNEEKTLTIEKGLVTISYHLSRMQGEENPELDLQDLSFTHLVSADRLQNPSTGTYYLKEGVAEGEIAASFEGEEPDENAPLGKYPVVITSTLTSDKYDFVVAEENYLWVQGTPQIEIINFPENVYYGDSIAIEVSTTNDADPTFTYKALVAEEESVEKVIFDGSTMIATAVGLARIEVTVQASGAYLSASTTHEFEVHKRPLTASAGNYDRDPGEENPELVIAYNGFCFGEDESDLDEIPTIHTTATIDSPLGFYEVIVEGGEAQNYTIVPVNGQLSILATPALEIVNFPEAVRYGDVFHVEYALGNAEDLVPHFHAVAVDSMKNADFLAETESSELTAVGAGPARIELVIDPVDYYRGVSIVKDFEVTKAILTVTAQDATRFTGEENPEFELLYDGFKFDDIAQKEGVFITAPSATTEADKDSPNGFYDIIVIPGEATNYDIVAVNGQLEVRSGVGIGTTEMGAVSITSGTGSIRVEGNENFQTVSVYDVVGNLIATRNQAEIVFDGLLSNRIYIVKVGNKAVRVIVK